jgi:hypothetical protein
MIPDCILRVKESNSHPHEKIVPMMNCAFSTIFKLNVVFALIPTLFKNCTPCPIKFCPLSSCIANTIITISVRRLSVPLKQSR